MTTEILFVRHGQTAWNVERRRQGHSGPGLNEQGREDARRAASELVEMNACCRISAIYSSDLARAAETAEIIGEALGLPVHLDERLRERHQGIWQGRLTTEVMAEHAEVVDFIGEDPLGGGPPEGETGQQVLERMTDALNEIAAEHPGERVVVVSHGGAISLVRWLALAALDRGFLTGPVWNQWPRNGEVIPIDWPPAGEV